MFSFVHLWVFTACVFVYRRICKAKDPNNVTLKDMDAAFPVFDKFHSLGILDFDDDGQPVWNWPK